MLTVAIGDVHGCYNELLQFMEHIQKATYGQECKFVFLGDYMDRGPDSRSVIQYLMDLDNRGLNLKNEMVFLRGNHEDMSMNDYNNWIINGGDKTLESYSNNRISEEHKNWLNKTVFYYKDKQRTYVHAGIIRGVELEEQKPDTMMWIRDKFLDNVSPKGGYIVHGHTPVKQVTLRPNRCNLDTGCVFGNVLSAGIFNEEQVEPIMIINHKGEKTNVGNS